MRQTAILATAALLVLPSGCQKATEQQTQKHIDVPDDTYRQRLEALTEPERNATFGRAIRDAGLTCQWVTNSSAAGDVGGRPVWQARCMEGAEFALVLQKGGVLQVVAPKAMGETGR